MSHNSGRKGSTQRTPLSAYSGLWDTCGHPLEWGGKKAVGPHRAHEYPKKGVFAPLMRESQSSFSTVPCPQRLQSITRPNGGFKLLHEATISRQLVDRANQDIREERNLKRELFRVSRGASPRPDSAVESDQGMLARQDVCGPAAPVPTEQPHQYSVVRRKRGLMSLRVALNDDLYWKLKSQSLDPVSAPKSPAASALVPKLSIGQNTTTPLPVTPAPAYPHQRQYLVREVRDLMNLSAAVKEARLQCKH